MKRGKMRRFIFRRQVMGVLALKAEKSLNFEMELNSSLHGGFDGKLCCSKDEIYFFHKNGEMLHAYNIRNIEDVEFHESEEDSYIRIIESGHPYQYSIKEDIEIADKFYYHIKKNILGDNTIKNFQDQRVNIFNITCNKMFDNEMIARFLDGTNKLYEGEEVQAALIGRYCPNFTSHIDGVLAVTNKRIFFFNRHKILRSLDRNEYKSCRVINAFDDFVDEHGRKTYDVELNDSTFMISVTTDRHIKIEAFYSVVEPGKQLKENF